MVTLVHLRFVAQIPEKGHWRRAEHQCNICSVKWSMNGSMSANWRGFVRMPAIWDGLRHAKDILGLHKQYPVSPLYEQSEPIEK